MGSGPITSWQIDEEKMETVTDFIFLGSKITGDNDCSHKIKRRLLLGKKSYDKPRQYIKKQRHHFADKGPYSQRYNFSSSHVQVWEKSVVRFQTFPAVWELLWYSCSPVCDSPAWRLYCVANGHLLQEDLMPHAATPRTAIVRASVSAAGHCWLMPLQGDPQTLKGRSAAVSCGSHCSFPWSWCTQVLFVPSNHLWQVWSLSLNVIGSLLPSYCSFSFAVDCGVSFFGGCQHSPVDDCSVASYNFGILAGEDERMSFCSAILGLIFTY